MYHGRSAVPWYTTNIPGTAFQSLQDAQQYALVAHLHLPWPSTMPRGAIARNEHSPIPTEELNL